MAAFLIYILKSAFVLALLVSLFMLFMSRETFHKVNRYIMLSIVFIALLLPAVNLGIESPFKGLAAAIENSFAAEEPEAFVGEIAIDMSELPVLPDVALELPPLEPVEEKPFNWMLLAAVAYFAGVAFLVVRQAVMYVQVARIIARSRVVDASLYGCESISLRVHTGKEKPFSWFRWVVVSEDDLGDGAREILIHETAHARAGHSWDIVLADAVIIMQWFNPLAWIMKNSLKDIHEFEADEAVINSGVNAKQYQLLIIKKAVGARLYSIANSFNHSSLKKRITMMIKKKSNPWARLKYLYVLPLAAVAVAAFARPEVSNKLDEISNTKINDLVSVSETFVQENKDTLHKVQYFEVKAVSENAPTKLNVRVEEGKKPLLIVDGAPWPLISLDNINAEMVESVTVLKGKEAVDLYGEKAKDGAVVIVSKRSQETIENENKKNNVPMRIAFTQEALKVSGTVLAADTKIPVMGASVIIRGTTNGTLTDHDGKFTLGGLRKGDVIRVSFVGFQTRSVIVKDESPLTIMLDDAVQNLEGMVVYAPTQKSEKDEVVVFDMPMEEVKQKEVKDEPIFQVVEEKPEFPGGMAEAMKFLAKNINYPVAAQQAKIEGRVIVQFVVGKDGSVSDVKVMRGVSPELDAEAIRVVSMMPKWIPGKQRGKAVAVKYTMPIMFRLQTPEPKKEETASFQQINLKVDGDANQANVDAVKDYFKDGRGIKTTATLDGRRNIETDSSLVYVVVVDGVEKGFGVKALREVPVQTIQSMEVLSAKNAIAKYGEKAKDGAIEIKTKKNKK